MKFLKFKQKDTKGFHSKALLQLEISCNILVVHDIEWKKKKNAGKGGSSVKISPRRISESYQFNVKWFFLKFPTWQIFKDS